MNPSRPVLWIDPGEMTGLACWWPEDKSAWIDEFDFFGAAEQIRRICGHFNVLLDIGWEHFRITPKTPPDGAHYAIEMIGVAREHQLLRGCRNVGPAMPDQRNNASPAMLKAIGWWRPGKDDAQSAAQHLLAWMMRTGQVPDSESVVLADLRSRSGEEDGSNPVRRGQPNRRAEGR